MNTRALRILISHPGAELFGSDRMALESVRGILQAGHTALVALPADGPLVPLLRQAGAEVVILRMLVLRKSLMKPSGWVQLFLDTFSGLKSAWSLISKFRPDAVYVSTITIPEWPVIARIRGIHVVTHVHEAEASGNRLINSLLYSPHLAAHRVLVNSQFSLQTINRSLPALARRSEVVYNGVVGPSVPTAPRARLDNTLRVLYIGRLSPRKGPDLLISAATVLRDQGIKVEVALLGAVFPGYEWYERDLRQQVSEGELDNDVDFLGFRRDVWPHLEACDVLVVPSRVDEPFGNTAVEGILAHRAVIVSETSGLREAAGGYATASFIPADDYEALAGSLMSLVNDWPASVASVASSANEAARRHSPNSYQSLIVEALRVP